MWNLRSHAIAAAIAPDEFRLQSHPATFCQLCHQFAHRSGPIIHLGRGREDETAASEDAPRIENQ